MALLPNRWIGRFCAQNLKDFLNLMSGMAKKTRDLDRNILVDAELHSSTCWTWLATKGSISLL